MSAYWEMQAAIFPLSIQLENMCYTEADFQHDVGNTYFSLFFSYNNNNDNNN